MPAFLVRWPQGWLSIVTADNIREPPQELAKDGICSNGEWDSPHGMIIELPKGFRLHFEFTQ